MGVTRTMLVAFGVVAAAASSPAGRPMTIRDPITNERDYRVPVDQGLQLFTALQRRGVPSEGMVFRTRDTGC